MNLKRQIMNRIHIKSFGLATGLTAALLCLGCVMVMKLAGTVLTKEFFNSLMHGIDVSTILRMDISITETVLGLLQTFMIAWLTGASIASIYNIISGLRSKKELNDKDHIGFNFLKIKTIKYETFRHRQYKSAMDN
jgi:hypothetical protein